MHYGVHLLDDTRFAQRFLSHIIFYKFSFELREAFKNELDEDCPSLAQIFDSYCKVITQLGNIKKEKALENPSSKFNKLKSKSKSKNKFSFNYKKQVLNFTPHCRFCQKDGHSSVDCTTFTTYQQRIEKCEELKLCIQCSSPYHSVGPLCPASKTGPGGLYRACKYCSSLSHVAALCNNTKPTISANVCLSSHGGEKSKFLLPIIKVKFESRSGRTVSLNALFDTGSSRSYLNPRVAKLLEVGSPLVNHEVNNFL